MTNATPYRGASFDNWGALLGAIAPTRLLGHEQDGMDGKRRVLSENLLRAMYSSGGYASLIVDIRVQEMTRKGFTVFDDNAGDIPKFFADNGINKGREDLIRWSSLFGGALGVMQVNDGQRDLTMPLRETSVKSFKGLKVYDRWRTSWSSGDLYKDTANPKFGTPEFYWVMPIDATLPMFRIHESRCVRMDGEPVDDLTRIENLGWGDSYVTRCYQQICELLEGFDSVNDILDDFMTDVFSIDGLMEKIMHGDLKAVKERVDLMRYTKNKGLGVMLDSSGEQYSKQASSVSGVADVIDRLKGALAAVSRNPQALLYGESPAGQNATGDSDWENHYNNIGSLQTNRLMPVDTRLVYVASLVPASAGGPTKGKPLANATIIYTPLKQLGELDAAKLRKEDATTARTFVEIGAVHPDEVRFGAASSPLYAGLFKLDTKYDKPETRPRTAPAKPDDGEGGEEDPENPEGKPPAGKAVKKKKEPAA